MRVFAGVVIVFLSACSNYEQDKNNPYFNSQLNDKQTGYTVSPLVGDPIAALVIGGIGLAANPDYYKTQGISGKCIIVTAKETPIEIPCKDDVQVILKSGDGKESATTSIRQGEFAFKVKKDIPYELLVDARGFELVNENVKSLVFGDRVVLKIRKIKKSKISRS